MSRHEQAMQTLRQGTVIPATPLALDAGRRFDRRRQRLLMRYYLAAGAGGIATAVHTTQFEIRKPEYGLFEPVLETVAEEIERYERNTGKSIVRIAGVCGQAVQAAQEAAAARALGYDAVLLSPGGLGGLTEAELIDRTKAVASVMPVIAFYLQPAAGGRVFSYSYWERVFEIENVVAVKAAPFNRYQTCELVRAAALSPRADHITLYTGNDDNIVVDLLTKYQFHRNDGIVEKRFAGGLLGHWSVWTHQVVRMFEQIKRAAAGDTIPAELLALAAEVTDANSAVFDTAHGFAGCIPGVHEVLRRQGLLEGTWCLNPEEVLSSGQAEEIERVYRMYPHLNDDAFVAQHLQEWMVGLS